MFIARFLSPLSFLLLSLLVSVPFLVPWRFFPDVDFYADNISLLMVTVFILIILLTRPLFMPLPRVSFILLIFAAYLFIQARLLALPYIIQSDRVSLTFILLAIMAWGVHILANHSGRNTPAQWIMWGLTIGVLLQALVIILQFSDNAINFHGWISYDNEESDRVFGQMKQRNLLGHYMMWGIIATTYLLAIRKMPTILGVMLIVFLGGVLALVDSRTIVTYPAGIATVLIYARIVAGASVNRIITFFAVVALWVLLSQWITPVILGFWGIEVTSGLTRLAENTSAVFRWREWEKAWYIFLDNPLFGHGWGSFAYESFIRDALFTTPSDIQSSRVTSHSHNIMLQILAETGILGFIIIFGGLLWSVIPILKRISQNLSVALLILLAVSLCHSLLEYPLWVVYFLPPFIAFLALGQSIRTDKKTINTLPVVKSGLIIITTVSLIIIGSTVYHYPILARQFSMKAHNIPVTQQATYQLATTMPLMGYYLDSVVAMRGNPATKEIPSSIIALNNRLNRYQPNFAVANRQGLYLYRQGEKEKAQQWLEKVWKYYPAQLSVSRYYIYAASPLFVELEMPIYQYCKTYQPLYPEDIINCPPPPSQKPVPLMLQRQNNQ